LMRLQNLLARLEVQLSFAVSLDELGEKPVVITFGVFS